MGTWGSGNFQNDGALDYLGDVVDGLAKRIDDILALGAADADDSGETELVPSVALIELVTRNCNGAPPRPDRIVAWHTAYLVAYDRSMPNLDPTGNFLAERRAVIVATFASLEQHARDFWKD